MDTPKQIGKYEVSSQIAAGGFGVIYKAWDPFIKRTVAIKMCASPDEEVRQRFQQEAQFVGNLVHRNITLVFDFGVQDEIPYIVQEFLTGYDLDELVRAGVVNDTQTVISILLQVCEGLEFAHARGIIHRDIKPSNIRVLEDGTVKIMDFGIAKSLEGGSKLTQTGIALGTAGYLAPEQIQGGTVDPRTDIFAFGVVAYELVTGRRPFEGASLSNVLYQILNDEPTQPTDIAGECSPGLQGVILKCMSKNPADRYQNVREILDALRSIPGAVSPSGGESVADATTGVLRVAMANMDPPTVDDEPPTRDLSAAELEDEETERVETGGGGVTELSRTPEIEEDDPQRRSPVMIIFLTLLLLVIASATALYLSEDLQTRVFGPEGAPWVPTPTPTPTATPTPTLTPTTTPTPTMTETPVPEATPTPAPVTVRLHVDPPASVSIDGRDFDGGKKTSGGSVSLLPGSHTFTVSIPDFPTRRITRNVDESTRTIVLNLDLGLITVMGDPALRLPGGAVFLDGDRLGSLPLVRKKVPTGKHELVVRWPDAEQQFRRTIEIPPAPAVLALTVAPGGGT
jgi:serine/threonine-protein kinase